MEQLKLFVSDMEDWEKLENQVNNWLAEMGNTIVITNRTVQLTNGNVLRSVAIAIFYTLSLTS